VRGIDGADGGMTDLTSGARGAEDADTVAVGKSRVDALFGKFLSTSIALCRGAGGKAWESSMGGVGEGNTVEHGWTGTDEAGVKLRNASMALFRGRGKSGGVGADGGVEEPGTAGARHSERGVLPSVGCDMVAEQKLINNENKRSDKPTLVRRRSSSPPH
jgi:hypothetical protein